MRIDSPWLRLGFVAVCCVILGYGLGAMHQYGKAVEYANTEIARLCPPSLQGVGGVGGFNLSTQSPYIGTNASLGSGGG